MCGRYYGTGFEPIGEVEEYNIDWGDSFGKKTVYIKTPMRKEDISMPEECSIRYLADRIFAKAKYKPPTFAEFCEATKIYEDFNINDLELIYLVEYKDEVVGTLRSKIIVPLDAFGTPKLASKDIREAIQEYKLQMYHRLTQEYDKKNKEANIKEEKNMDKNHWIEGLPAVKKVETYNQRVVKVTFIDDTFTKSVCSENDHFDLDVGITICAMKRLLGTNSDNATREYNRFMNHVHKMIKKNEREKLEAKAQKLIEKDKKRKAELKKAANKLKAREEQIDIQKQAIIRAQKEMEAME